jgi:hypothetical protein
MLIMLSPSCLEQDVVGDVGLGDPGLLAVDRVAAVFAHRLAAQGADVGAGFGLRHRDRLDRAPGDPAEDLLLLRVGAEALVRPGGDRGDGEAGDRDLPVGHLLEQEAEVDHAAARAAVGLGDGDAEPTQLGDLGVEVDVVRLLAAVGQRVALLAGAALAGREVADRGDECLLLGREGDWHLGLP